MHDRLTRLNEALTAKIVIATTHDQKKYIGKIEAIVCNFALLKNSYLYNPDSSVNMFQTFQMYLQNVYSEFVHIRKADREITHLYQIREYIRNNPDS
jgi:hypothetical protein